MDKDNENKLSAEQVLEDLQEIYGRRPARKPDAECKGRLSIWKEEGAYYFNAAKENPALKREVVFDKCGVKVSKTPGQKESSYCLSARISADSENPESDLLNKVYEQLAPKARKAPKFCPQKFYIDRKDELQVWKNSSKKQVNILITLDATKNTDLLQMEILKHMTEINKLIVSQKF